ncbi:hypothetical protein E2C01_022652 [Portunus trituberculatus]|uniref:Uncharacterized protein n=1 Tax=Portunus trituberculatus TaxID=210409 RepID=A0A5B7E5Y5_PORTR|nr:hypothetical protein [Portunus trituberculatus]
MKTYITHSLSQPKLSKPWFNTACSRAKRYRGSLQFDRVRMVFHWSNQGLFKS